VWGTERGQMHLDTLLDQIMLPPDNDVIRATLEQHGAREVRCLARSVHDLPIWCAVGGGSKLPAILIASGSHADETSGFTAASYVLAALETEHTVYVVPNRDPVGIAGFAQALRTATGTSGPIETPDDVAGLLYAHGEVLVQDGRFILARVGDLFFANVATTPDSFGSEKAMMMVQRHLRLRPDLAARLAFKRIIVPANAADCPDRTLYDRGYTAFIAGDGGLFSYNRFFGHVDAPPEVRAVQELIDSVRPGLALDLHEGWDNGFYWFVPEDGWPDPTMAAAVEGAIIEALTAADLRTSTLTELLPTMPQEHLDRFEPQGHGRLVWRWPSPAESPWGVAYQPYCLEYGVAYQTEIGRWSPTRRRLEYQLLATCAAVNAFEARW
jgi:hypothetical protein